MKAKRKAPCTDGRSKEARAEQKRRMEAIAAKWERLGMVRTKPSGRRWAVEPDGDYGRECNLGAEYALRFLEEMEEDPNMSQCLGQIVYAMIEAGNPSGVTIGFFSVIGSVLQSCTEEQPGWSTRVRNWHEDRRAAAQREAA